MRHKKVRLSALLLFCVSLIVLQAQTVKDIDGNVYKTVTIGKQVWIAENLKTTKFNDSTSIPLVIENTAWSNLKTPGYCWYSNNESSYKVTYGALYNWYTVNTRKLCPTGWHVPSNAEWTTLTTFLGGRDIAGGKLKEAGFTHWTLPNTGATNESGFTILPGGTRNQYGKFYLIGTNGYWWSSTGIGKNYAWFRRIYFFYSIVHRDFGPSRNGRSIRCIKDK
jgi:uncharacterized protein (TIGR02145 family)